MATQNPDARIIVDAGDGVRTEYMLTNGEPTGRVITDAKGVRKGTIETVGHPPIADFLPALAAERVDGVFADLDGVETVLRAAAHARGAARLQATLEQADAKPATPTCPHCSQPMERHHTSTKTFMSRLGPIEIERTFCYGRTCRKGFFPLDRALGLEGETRMPGAAKRVTDAVDSDSYAVASRKRANLSRLRISAKTLNRAAIKLGQAAQDYEQDGVKVSEIVCDRIYLEVDGTGVPMRKSETEGVKGKQADGAAKTREAKVIDSFTADGIDPKTGLPVKDKGSDWVSGSIDRAAAVGCGSGAPGFGARLDRHLCRTGADQATEVKEVIVISDGARWIKKAAEALLGNQNVTYILEAFHAFEYASDAVKELVAGQDKRKIRLEQIKTQLLNGAVETVIAELTPHRQQGDAIARCIDDYAANKDRMRYDDYRARGLQIGSGQIESRCKTLVASRFKNSGARCSKVGANALMALKSCWANGQWEEFVQWKVRHRMTA